MRGLNTGWRVLDDDTPFGVAPEGLRGGKIALGIRLSLGHILGRNDDRKTVPQADALQHRLDLLPQCAGANRQRIMPPHAAHKRLDTGQRPVFAVKNLPHHRFFFVGHHPQECLGIELPPALLKNMLECALVVESDQLVVIFILEKIDMLPPQHFRKRHEVKRLAVNDHAVKIKQQCPRPKTHE